MKKTTDLKFKKATWFLSNVVSALFTLTLSWELGFTLWEKVAWIISGVVFLVCQWYLIPECVQAWVDKTVINPKTGKMNGLGPFLNKLFVLVGVEFYIVVAALAFTINTKDAAAVNATYHKAALVASVDTSDLEKEINNLDAEIASKIALTNGVATAVSKGSVTSGGNLSQKADDSLEKLKKAREEKVAAKEARSKKKSSIEI